MLTFKKIVVWNFTQILEKIIFWKMLLSSDIRVPPSAFNNKLNQINLKCCSRAGRTWANNVFNVTNLISLYSFQVFSFFFCLCGVFCGVWRVASSRNSISIFSAHSSTVFCFCGSALCTLAPMFIFFFPIPISDGPTAWRVEVII